MTTIPKNLLDKLCLFLNFHERSCITGTQCIICANFMHMKLLDKDINGDLIKNFCREDKETINKMNLKKITNKAQRIHIIGNVWSVINSLKHRKFKFFCREMGSVCNKDSICITDASIPVKKIDTKLIITQGYRTNYDLSSVDYLLIEKRHINEDIIFKDAISDKGFLVIDLNSSEKFYTE